MALGDYVKTAYANGTTPAINATNLNNIEDKVYELDRTVIQSGVYTPTLTNVTNVAASAAAPCQYMRVGDVVTVAGRIDIDLTSGTTASELGVTVPIASDFALSYQAAGDCIASDGAGVWSISADVTNNRASFQTSSVAATANTTYYFTFTYRIL